VSESIAALRCAVDACSDPLWFPQGITETLAFLDRSARILDFGCGDGRSVVQLRNAGWDAWGVDIDAARIARAADSARLLLIDDGRAPFGDGSFDLVISNQVFEHVERLEPAVAEIVRLTKPGGLGLHEWPGKWRPVEPHLAMPFVHWLPKNRLRYAAIYAWATAGIYPTSAPPKKTHRELAEIEYRYSVHQTFYRPVQAVAATLEAHGLEVEPVTHSRLEPMGLGPARSLAERAFRTFRTATLRTRKTA
jgi:SAM-dependent methyltransferase